MARPQLVPTDENRRMVRSLAGLGVRQEQIAVMVDIAPGTLRKHFRRELTIGPIETNAKVANTGLKMAISGQHPTMTKLWMETRCGFRANPRQDPNDVPVPQFHITIEGTEGEKS